MTKTTADLIKEVRVSNNLTQKQFAKRFFITEKTISNYENGKRSPDLEFITKVCNEFNLSLDYFMNKAKKESLPQDLIVSMKNGKYAIYDKAQSIYLTQHIYDDIILSDCGNHIVVKAHYTYDEKGNIDDVVVTYSALVDNKGNIKEFPDLQLGSYGGFSEGVCPAFSKTTNKVHLVDNNGNILSRGYDQIRLVENQPALGLYYGLEWSDQRGEFGRRILKERKLLYKTGEELDCAIFNINDPVMELIIKEFNDIENACNFIEKYGANLLCFIPWEVFTERGNYIKLLSAVDRYGKNRKEYTTHLLYAIKRLSSFAGVYEAKWQLQKKELINELPISFKLIPNRIEQNFIKKNIFDLLARLGFIFNE